MNHEQEYFLRFGTLILLIIFIFGLSSLQRGANMEAIERVEKLIKDKKWVETPDT